MFNAGVFRNTLPAQGKEELEEALEWSGDHGSADTDRASRIPLKNKDRIDPTEDNSCTVGGMTFFSL